MNEFSALPYIVIIPRTFSVQCSGHQHKLQRLPSIKQFSKDNQQKVRIQVSFVNLKKGGRSESRPSQSNQPLHWLTHLINKHMGDRSKIWVALKTPQKNSCGAEKEPCLPGRLPAWTRSRRIVQRQCGTFFRANKGLLLPYLSSMIEYPQVSPTRSQRSSAIRSDTPIAEILRGCVTIMFASAP